MGQNEMVRVTLQHWLNELGNDCHSLATVRTSSKCEIGVQYTMPVYILVYK